MKSELTTLINLKKCQYLDFVIFGKTILAFLGAYTVVVFSQNMNIEPLPTFIIN